MQHTDLNLQKSPLCPCGIPATGMFQGQPCCVTCGRRHEETAKLVGSGSWRFEPFGEKVRPAKKARQPVRGLKDW